MANTIPFWGTYTPGAEFDYDPGQTQPGEQFLSAARKYDPNARFVPFERNHQTHWRVQLDASKIPGYGKVVDVNPQDYPSDWSPLDTGMTFDQYLATGRGNFQAPLIDTGAVRDDPVLGRVTEASNVQWPSDTGPLGILGPLGVLAFAWGAPYLASAMSGGVLGSGAAAGGAAGAGGTGAMDITGSTGTGLAGSAGANIPLGSSESSLYGTGVLTAPETALGGPSIGGGLLANAPLGSAESSLYGTGVQTAPETALGGSSLTQPAAPIIDRGTPARAGDVLRNGGIPGPSNLWQSATEFLDRFGLSPGDFVRAGSNLLGGGTGTGAGGGIPGGTVHLGGGGSSPDIVGLLRRFYGLDEIAASQAMRNARMRGGYG